MNESERREKQAKLIEESWDALVDGFWPTGAGWRALEEVVNDAIGNLRDGAYKLKPRGE